MTGAERDKGVSFRDVLQARKRIVDVIHRTPVRRSPALEEKFGLPVYLKLEHHQRTGSFKLRGALNAVRCLSASEAARGVIGVSTGNYGRALAYAAKMSDIRCLICMSTLAPQNKLQGVRDCGAEVRVVGSSQDEAQLEVERVVEKDGMVMLPPFDHPEVIAGQGTLAIEILEDVPDAATIVVPVSGGGLAAGVALAAKTLAPDITIIGVSMEKGAAMHASIQAGKPVQVQEYESLADSLGGGIGLENRYTFNMVRGLVDDIVLLSEEEIAEGMRHGYRREREVLEGGGAVAIGALLAAKIEATGPLVLLLTGKNIDMKLHHRIVTSTR